MSLSVHARAFTSAYLADSIREVYGPNSVFAVSVAEDGTVTIEMRGKPAFSVRPDPSVSLRLQILEAVEVEAA